MLGTLSFTTIATDLVESLRFVVFTCLIKVLTVPGGSDQTELVGCSSRAVLWYFTTVHWMCTRVADWSLYQ